jgi:hypothetical protein
MTKALAGGDEAGPAAGPGDADPGGDSATVPSAASEQ